MSGVNRGTLFAAMVAGKNHSVQIDIAAQRVDGSAVVLAGDVMKRLRTGELRRVLLAATGALMSPVSAMQGESIPAVCPAVTIEGEGIA